MSERLACLRVMGTQLRALLKPVNTTDVVMIRERFHGGQHVIPHDAKRRKPVSCFSVLGIVRRVEYGCPLECVASRCLHFIPYCCITSSLGGQKLKNTRTGFARLRRFRCIEFRFQPGETFNKCNNIDCFFRSLN